jgi:hypothetical protein
MSLEQACEPMPDRTMLKALLTDEQDFDKKKRI